MLKLKYIRNPFFYKTPPSRSLMLSLSSVARHALDAAGFISNATLVRKGYSSASNHLAIIQSVRGVAGDG